MLPALNVRGISGGAVGSLAANAILTIKFSKQVGDIMREIPRDREPEPQFKYYT